MISAPLLLEAFPLCSGGTKYFPSVLMTKVVVFPSVLKNVIRVESSGKFREAFRLLHFQQPDQFGVLRKQLFGCRFRCPTHIKLRCSSEVQPQPLGLSGWLLVLFPARNELVE